MNYYIFTYVEPQLAYGQINPIHSSMIIKKEVVLKKLESLQKTRYFENNMQFNYLEHWIKTGSYITTTKLIDDPKKFELNAKSSISWRPIRKMEEWKILIEMLKVDPVDIDFLKIP